MKIELTMTLASRAVAIGCFLSIVAVILIWGNWRLLTQRGSRRLIAVENFRIRVDQVQAIAAIERSPLRRRLERESGMTAVAADIAVVEYLAFLAIAAANPNRMVAPTSRACDEAWHAHILHTEAYDRDMRAIFGHPFHHHPTDDAEAPWLEEPQRRTEVMLEGFSGITDWPGIGRARSARDIPAEMGISTAAMLGMAIAEGPESFQNLAALYRTVGGAVQGAGRIDCGGGSCGGHSCGGSGCGGGH